ncbi:MAG: DUF2812 domain-containing protein [Faecalicatena sp.]|uniref:DUF2812 domain-containing protein n=1 Tax=Faecalicatena sp. TaxID=2005360 RepID=UPI00258A1584|nr:DUF2812 domain-containing protein [Faecalicatena sp.]MCI6465236.1 DUF2812 domain-containing protein [Faecalicatena sp.]MDY5620875.1 DUF2812 domain-containing protein [Lachnospiraceae bacterium]
MKNRKRILKQFHYWECDTFAEYLHNMSARGWHFKGWKLGLIFEKGEPEDIEYAVEVFPKGSEMDTRPEPEAQEYAEYCGAAGWKLVDGRRKFCVFRKERRDAVPIVTPEERLYNIKRAGRVQWFWEFAGIGFVTGMIWFQFLTLNFERWIFFDLMLLLLVGSLLGCLEKLTEGIAMLITAHYKRKELLEGRIPFYGGKGQVIIRYLKNYMWVVEIGAYSLIAGTYLLIAGMRGSAYLLLVPVSAGLVMLLFMAVLEIWRPSRANNWAVQMLAALGITIVLIPVIIVVVMTSGGEKPVLSKADIPLTQADYKEVSGQIVHTDEGHLEGILGSMRYFQVEYGESADSKEEEENTDTLWYYVFQTEHPWILNKVWQRYEKNAYQPRNCTAKWEAVSAFEGGMAGGLYTVRFQDKLLYMYSDESLDVEQIQIIKNKLQL